MLDNTNEPGNPSEQSKAVVFRKQLGHYYVRLDGREITCSISSKIRKNLVFGKAHHRVVGKDEAKVDPVAIGDEVIVEREEGDCAVITSVLPRRTKFSRSDPGLPVEHVMVANLDQVVFAVSAFPAPQWSLLDRCLASAEAADLPPLICMTKMDKADAPEVEREMEVYRALGYAFVLTSSLTGYGLDELKQSLTGRLSVLVGKSGVGKTSLLNAIQPGLGLRVKETSESTGKGKHTTTHVEMFDLEFGGQMVDTPGVRELGIWNGQGYSMDSLFPEMRPYLGQCRFGDNCTHSHEPGCAIKKAVEEQRISERRYQSYLRLK